MKRIGLFLLAVVMVAGMTGCEAEDKRGSKGEWRERFTIEGEKITEYAPSYFRITGTIRNVSEKEQYIYSISYSAFHGVFTDLGWGVDYLDVALPIGECVKYEVLVKVELPSYISPSMIEWTHWIDQYK